MWERGLPESRQRRALLLLEASGEGDAFDALARLNLGDRDARLLTLRERLFGARLVSITECPACAQRVEMEFAIADIRVPATAGPGGPLRVQESGYDVTFRLPNSLDLDALDPGAAPATNRLRLFELCVLEVRESGEPVPVAVLPPNLLERMAAAMAAADPQADVQLSLRCPHCAHAWEAVFDIAAYLWGEVHDWAGRVLKEVHVLASAYGWRENDILALSPLRRRAYLELLNA